MAKRKLIAVEPHTWDRLVKHKHGMDNFDDVINRVLDKAEGKK